MIIPNKYSGYQAGIRIYPGGGGGGPAPAPVAPPPPPPPPRMASAAPAPAFQTYGQGDRTGSLVQAGGGMRPSQLDYSKPIYDPNYADNITGYQQSSQFYQPIYQPQYQNYSMGNPMSVSQYGQQPQQPQMNWQTGQMTQPAPQTSFNPYANNFGGGFGGFGGFGGYGGGFGGGFDSGYGGGFGGFGGGFDSGYGGFMPQMQSPYSYQQPMQQAQPAQQSPLSSIGRAIVGRSSQMRGTPNVMRRAEGGIASLMDDE